jgi:hypothetical protein
VVAAAAAEADVPALGRLRLQPGEVPDRGWDRQLRAFEQELAGQRGAVERPVRQRRGRHQTRLEPIAVSFWPQF